MGTLLISMDTYLQLADTHPVVVVGEVLVRVALHDFRGHRSHIVVDHRKLHQREKDKHRARAHPHVDGLDVADGRQALLRLGVLRGQREQRGDAEGDTRGNGFGLDPERDPAHDHNQRGRDVGVEQVVAKAPLQIEDHRQAREIARRVLDGTVGGVVHRDVQLGQFNFRINDQRIGQVPNEHQVVVRVRHCGEQIDN